MGTVGIFYEEMIKSLIFIYFREYRDIQYWAMFYNKELGNQV